MVPEQDTNGLGETRSFKVLSPGTVISHYKIIEKIGEGGMGVVYKAVDTKLKRHVALKFLPPEMTGDAEAKERFIQEARVASSLDHPNICTVHEIEETGDGRMFIAMACYEGDTLAARMQDGPLSQEEAIDIAIQIAEGLEQAHGKGVVHRDIKPANIMLVPQGPLKIMDFGLAKLAGQAGVTRVGSAMGTVAYMSPEQARGEEVDDRSDLWSLGVVLYEMLDGEAPFKGEHWQVVLNTILTRNPVPVGSVRQEVPEELAAVVTKMLKKQADFRYQSAAEVLADLRCVRTLLESKSGEKPAGRSEPVPSVAVLPFLDMSPEKDQEYFCDGMAEEIINALSKLEGLRVASRTSAFQFRGKGHDIGEIGVKLKVDKVLEGSVRKAGSRLRITAQLVNADDGFHEWSEKYDRDLEDVFAIQDEISLVIVDNLKVKLLSDEKKRLLERHTEDHEAYALYMKGRYFWDKRTAESLKRAIKCFEQAIERDPGYAMAYVGLADAHIILSQEVPATYKEEYKKAREAVLRALRINDRLGEAYTTLAHIKAYCDWDRKAAQEAFKRSIELSPGYATAHHWYGMFLSDSLGRFDEAISEIKKARELDPLSLVISRNLGFTYYMARRSDEAIATLKQVVEMDPAFPGVHGSLAEAYLQKSMFKEALDEIAEEEALYNDPVSRSYLVPIKGRIYLRMGEETKAREILDDQLKHLGEPCVSEVDLAILCFGLGEEEKGFELLERAEVTGGRMLWMLGGYPEFDGVRSHPRFVTLLKRIGLAD